MAKVRADSQDTATMRVVRCKIRRSVQHSKNKATLDSNIAVERCGYAETINPNLSNRCRTPVAVKDLRIMRDGFTRLTMISDTVNALSSGVAVRDTRFGFPSPLHCRRKA
jgi:hypothetical protein